MGVRGIRHLLKDVGWLSNYKEEEDHNDDVNNNNKKNQPQSSSSCGCSTSLWKEWNASDSLGLTIGQSRPSAGGPPLTKIEYQSCFLIDGNGLAFYLHDIAYTRYLQTLKRSTTTTINNPHESCCCPTIKSTIHNDMVVEALPCMMPLSFLREATIEFISTLSQHVSKIKIYWDGPHRRYKTKTDEARQKERLEKESNMELFCHYGVLPSNNNSRGGNNNISNNNKYVCEFKQHFPLSRLFLLCVRHTIQSFSEIEMIDCIEEADVQLAIDAYNKNDTYIIGRDSDFFFYKSVQYIPINEISITKQSRSTTQSSSSLYAFVATRTQFAKLLGLEDAQMIQLAILLGNDYIDPQSMLQNIPNDIQLYNVQSITFYLQCHRNDDDDDDDNEALIQPKNEESQMAINFVKSLYDLHNLDDFDPALEDTTTADDSLLVEDTINNKNNNQQLQQLRNEFVLSKDSTLRDGLIRRLKETLLDGSSIFTQEGLKAYEMSTSSTTTTPQAMNTNYPNSTASLKITTRPSWEEMKMGFYIESFIRKIYKSSSSSSDSLMTRITPPDTLINRIHFHNTLISLRKQQQQQQQTSLESDTITEKKSHEAVPIPVTLPIDEHEEAILSNIKQHRVTIIHGETGCGKSSRVPVMLLRAPPPDGSTRKVRFFISQPRRIAAKALVERVRQCEPDLKDKFALRMGHGWKEYESNRTQVHFVTTGYLVRLLANHPERFDDCTHLVIDEVHERSVDTDILCLLCRRLLVRNKDIRLVLMSATLATKMYQEYFNVHNDPIHVGVRRYPIQEYFIEDLQANSFKLPSQEKSDALAIQKEIETKRCRSAPTSAELTKRFQLAARLTTIVGEPGASVLIFVPGMAEIISISEKIESFHLAGIRYTCYPIHGDIPFEEQMYAFDDPAEDEVKVIIATNAAESSVTLPYVDHVICLGLCRQITYNPNSHRQMLTPAWISQASATQRAGRTGRVRQGNVYRLYTRQAYEKYMEEFEPGEMVRIPLDSVILMLKQILNEEVIPIFHECIEPPPLDTIQRSFASLHRWNFLTEPSDIAEITSLGSFVSSLGIDLSLGSFIGLGIQFGVAAEAIEMAAMMSLPKTPFQISSPMWLSPGDYNETASKTYTSKCKFDEGLYSEALGLMNALWDYSETSNRNYWCIKNRIATKRWQQVSSSTKSLRKRVADFLGINEDRLQVTLPPKFMPREKILLLRLLKVWVFSESIVECAPSSLEYSHDGSVAVTVKGKPSSQLLVDDHLKPFLDTEEHPYKIVDFNAIEQSGVFDIADSFNLGSEFSI